MTAPSVVATIADRQDAPGVAIPTYDASVHFDDLDSRGTPITWSLENMPAGTGISINSSTGVLTITPNANDLAASFVGRIRATDSRGVTNYIDVPFVSTSVPTAAASFYVDGATGDDSNNGSSGAPWKTIGRACQVGPDTGGDVDIFVAPGDYRHTSAAPQILRPQNSGTDATHRIRWRVNGAGVVRILGPSSGSITHGLIIDPGIRWIVVERTADRYFCVDGEVRWGTGAGEVQKGDAPETVAHIKQGIRIYDGDTCVIGVHLTGCSDWDGCISTGASGSCTLHLSSDYHGTCFYPGGQDRADTFNHNGDARMIYDGAGLDLAIVAGGHGGGAVRRGSGCMRLMVMDGRWSGIPTFSSVEPDGNRAMTGTTRSAHDFYFYDTVIEGSGKPSDQPKQEGQKLEGIRNGCVATYHRDPHWNHIETACASWSNYAEDLRLYHGTYETSPGPIWEVRDYGSGNRPMGTLAVKNFIAIEPATDDNVIFSFIFNSGTWSNTLLAVAGGTIQCASRTAADLQIRASGAGGPGFIAVDDALTDYPGVFSALDVVTDANLDSRPAANVRAAPSQFSTQLALAVGDTHSRGQGVNLTTVAASDPGTGLTLHVDDAKGFVDPQDGNAAAGFFTTHQINVNGTNRTITAVDYINNRFTMASSFTRSPGEAVNLRIPSGSSPHRGYPAQ